MYLHIHDTKIFMKMRSEEDGRELQEDLNKLKKSGQTNGY